MPQRPASRSTASLAWRLVPTKRIRLPLEAVKGFPAKKPPRRRWDGGAGSWGLACGAKEGRGPPVVRRAAVGPGGDLLSRGKHYHRPRVLNGRVRDGNGCGHPGVAAGESP